MSEEFVMNRLLILLRKKMPRLCIPQSEKSVVSLGENIRWSLWRENNA